MGIADAFKEGFKFLNKLLDLFRPGKQGKQSAGGNSVAPKVQIPHEVTTIDMLRSLAKDIEWLPLQEDLPQREMDICWALQLTFQRLRHSRDVKEIGDILKRMSKLGFGKALKRFNADCPGLPSMLNVICECCCRLYDSKQVIQHLTPDLAKEISGDALEVCRNLLLPFVKRAKTHGLFPDSATAVGNSIGVFGQTLQRYSRDWSEDLEHQLRRAVEIIPAVLKGVDLYHAGISGKLKEFAGQVPSALRILSEQHPEKWVLALQELCGRRPPDNIRGPLCRLWRRLVVVAGPQAFEFLRKLVDVSFESLWTQVEFGTRSCEEDSEIAETVVGCIHDLVKQCWHSCGEGAGPYWHNQVRPIVFGYMMKRQQELFREAGPVRNYLQKVVLMIDRLPKEPAKEERTMRVKDILPAIDKADDSLCGAQEYVRI